MKNCASCNPIFPVNPSNWNRIKQLDYSNKMDPSGLLVYQCFTLKSSEILQMTFGIILKTESKCLYLNGQ